MTYSQFDPAMQGRTAWNAGKAVGTKRPLTQKQIWAIPFFLDREGTAPRWRDEDSALRHPPIADVVRYDQLRTLDAAA